MSLTDVGSDAFIETLGVEPELSDDPSNQSEDTKDTKETKASEDAGSTEDKEKDVKPDPDPEPDSTDWEARFKGQQAEWTKEHQAKLDLQAELDKLKGQTAVPESDTTDDQVQKEQDDWLAKWRDQAEEDPLAATEEGFKQQQKIMASIVEDNKKLEQLIYSQKLTMQEDQMRELHDDYDEMINDVLIPAWDKFPELKAQWHEKGGTARAGYDLAQKIKQSSEILSDPQKYEQDLREKIAEETRSGSGDGEASGGDSKKETPKTLSSVNSQNAVPPSRMASTGKSRALDGFFAGVEKEKQKRFS